MGPRVAILAFAIVAGGCAAPTPPRGQSPLLRSWRPPPPPANAVPSWRHKRYGITCQDRNRDGRCDLEEKDDGFGTDGYRTLLLDNDFDGYHDIEIREGGYAGTYEEREVHRPVRGVPRWNETLSAIR